ncbi:MAG: hypothetical protein F6K21_13900 [Symploca sp. SIO2D2]|nr:hypothetical protein [Symploca sp. SIO2D2]
MAFQKQEAGGRRQKSGGSPDEKDFSPPYMKIPLSLSPRPRVYFLNSTTSGYDYTIIECSLEPKNYKVQKKR